MSEQSPISGAAERALDQKAGKSKPAMAKMRADLVAPPRRGKTAEPVEMPAQSELVSSKALQARAKRLEADVATYRAARNAAEFKTLDLRAALDHAMAELETLRSSPPYTLGSLLIASRRDWRTLLRLPGSLIDWRRKARRHRENLDARIVPDGTAAEYNAAIERALEVGDKQGLEAAGRWAVDQRFRASVLARVLSELAGVARKSDINLAVRLAEEALDADPAEGRIKRVAFMMGAAGSVTAAARLLRSAIAKGATLSATEEIRAEDLFALAEFAVAGLPLLKMRSWVRPTGADNRKVLIFAPQSYPYHWTSAAIRTHALSLSLIDADISVDVATPPGYPDLGNRKPKARAPLRHIDGIDYHLMPPTDVPPGFGEDYISQTAAMLVSLIRKLDATTLIASSEIAHAYPAAIAAQTAGIALVLDSWSATPLSDECKTERGRIMARAEDQLIDKAHLVLSRTPAIAERFRTAAPATNICLAPDFTPHRPAVELPDKWASSSFVFGYVGDNTPDIDFDGLAELLKDLIAKGVDARLVVYSVGSRIKALGDRLELAGYGGKFEIIEKSPDGKRLDLAFHDMDVIVVPNLPTEDAIRTPFHILAAVRHGKCVLAIGSDEHRDMLGSSVLYAEDSSSAVRILLELAADPDRRRSQEAQAREWDREHPGDQPIVAAIRSL